MARKTGRPLTHATRTSATTGGADHRAWLALRTHVKLMLIVLRDELYDGRWESMVSILRERLAGRDYVFKLVARTRQDLQRIEDPHAFEQQYGINASGFLPRE